MSTKSSALFPARKGMGVPQNLCPELCTSLIPPAGPGKVALKTLSDSSLSFSVRPLCVPADLPVIYGCMSREYSDCLSPDDMPPPQLEEAYSSILASDFAQSFMGLVNDIPVCQVDIYKTKMDAISLCYEARPGDYGLHLLTAPRAVRNHAVELLGGCVIRMPYKIANLYICTRKSFGELPV